MSSWLLPKVVVLNLVFQSFYWETSDTCSYVRRQRMTVEFTKKTYFGEEGKPVVTEIVVRDGFIYQPITVRVTTSRKTAGYDDFVHKTVDIIFEPIFVIMSDLKRKSISIELVDDDVVEPREEFTVSMSSSSSLVTLGKPATVVIKDNDKSALLCKPKTDLILLVDRSSSIQQHDYNKMGKFVRNMAKELKVGERNEKHEIIGQAAIVTFSNKGRKQITLKESQDAKKFYAVANKMHGPLLSGRTKIHRALAVADTKVAIKEAGYREDDPDVKKILMVIRDGKQAEESVRRRDYKHVEDSMEPFYNRGMDVFGIYVGLEKGSAINEIKDLVQFPENAIRVDNFTDLVHHVEDIIKKFCPGCNKRCEKPNRTCDTFTLNGAVKNNDGVFLEDATIVLSESPFKILARTNISGHFILRGVCKSEDNIIVSRHGYLSQIIKTTKTNPTVTAILKENHGPPVPQVILQSETELVENFKDDWYPDVEASVCYVKVAVENIDDCPNKTASFRVESVIGKEQRSAGYVVITMTEVMSTACAEYKCPQSDDHDVMVKVVPSARGTFTRNQPTTRKFIDKLKPSISNILSFKPELYLRDPKIGVYHSDEEVFTDENVEKNRKRAHCMEGRIKAGVRFRYCKNKLCRTGKPNSACDVCTCYEDTLTGTVKNNAGVFLDNAAIVLSEFPFKVLARTNISGYFTLKGACLSEEYVIVSKDGYLSQIIKTKMINPTKATVNAILKTVVTQVMPVILQSQTEVESFHDDWYPDVEASVCYVKVAVENIDDCPNKTASFRVESVIGNDQQSAGYVMITMKETMSRACAEYKCPQSDDHDVMVKVVNFVPGGFTKGHSATQKLIAYLNPVLSSNLFSFKPEFDIRNPRIGILHSSEKVFTDEDIEKNKKKTECMRDRIEAGVRFHCT